MQRLNFLGMLSGLLGGCLVAVAPASADTVVTYDLSATGTWTSGQNHYSGTTGTDTFTGTL
jgi:hypothetical protein